MTKESKIQVNICIIFMNMSFIGKISHAAMDRGHTEGHMKVTYLLFIDQTNSKDIHLPLQPYRVTVLERGKNKFYHCKVYNLD